MSDNLKDILSSLSTEIDQETLLLYLQDKLPADRKQEVERSIAENEFANDALDGLQQVKDKKEIAHMVEMMNRDLRKKIQKNRRRRGALPFRDQFSMYMVIFIFLILMILCYLIIHRMMKG